MRFAPLSKEIVADLALKNGLAESQAAADAMAQSANGSLEMAARLQDEDLLNFQQSVPKLLATSWKESLRVAKGLIDFVEGCRNGQPVAA